MYNLDFQSAHGFFGEWKKIHPRDPMGPASDAAAVLFSEFARMHVLESEFSLPEETRVKVTIPDSGPPGRPSRYEPLRDIIAEAAGLPDDMANNHNHYLHGGKRS